MRYKQFTKKEAKSKIKEVLKIWKKNNYDGKLISLKNVIGDYTYNSMNRYIKETLFVRIDDSRQGPYGAQWILRFDEKPKKLAKRVMKNKNILKMF